MTDAKDKTWTLDELSLTQVERWRLETKIAIFTVINECYRETAGQDIADTIWLDEVARRLLSLIEAAESSRRDWAAEALKWREYTGTAEDKSYDWLVAFGLEHHDFPRVCACVTDEQAKNLAAGFSRPVCAVHPQETP